jgi:hypothetical protein
MMLILDPDMFFLLWNYVLCLIGFMLLMDNKWFVLNIYLAIFATLYCDT